jgi:hypothetical protein
VAQKDYPSFIGVCNFLIPIGSLVPLSKAIDDNSFVPIEFNQEKVERSQLFC